MPAPRSMRVARRLHREIAELLLSEVRDPRLASVTITDVEVSDDLQVARVYYQTLGDANPGPVKSALNSALGFIRSAVAKRVSLRRAPELRFILDDSLHEGEKMEHLLRGLREQGEMGLEEDESEDKGETEGVE